MYNGYAPTPGEDSSPSNMNATPNDLSASGPGPANLSGFQLNGDEAHFDLSGVLVGPQHPFESLINVFQHPLVHPGGVYSGGPSHQHNLSNATATSSSRQGHGGGVPTIMPFGGLPTAPVTPNVPSGQAVNPGASFQVTDQPPTMTWHDQHPGVFARPNAQGIPGPLWQLVYAATDYPGGDDLRVVIHFKKIPSL